jgi:hypothetical protein
MARKFGVGCRRRSFPIRIVNSISGILRNKCMHRPRWRKERRQCSDHEREGGQNTAYKSQLRKSAFETRSRYCPVPFSVTVWEGEP